MSGRVTQSKQPKYGIVLPCSLCSMATPVFFLRDEICIDCTHDELERVRKERNKFKKRLNLIYGVEEKP